MSVISRPKQTQQPIKTKENITTSQWELRVITSTLLEVWENVRDEDAVGFSFESYWFSGWCDFSGPTTERSKTKSNKTNLTLA